MNNLATVLGFGGILLPDDVEYVMGFFKEQILKPGNDFLPLGKVCNKIGYVDSGVLRAVSVGNDGIEVTKYFVRANQFAVEIESFYDNKPSRTGLQAVTACKIFSIERNAWNKLNEKVPKLYILTKSLTEASLLNKIKDNEFLHFGSAKDKYLEFIRRYPDLALHVPLQYIASYLQITPQSLSRIRREIC